MLRADMQQPPAARARRRPPLGICSEAEFEEDLYAFLAGRGEGDLANDLRNKRINWCGSNDLCSECVNRCDSWQNICAASASTGAARCT